MPLHQFIIEIDTRDNVIVTSQLSDVIQQAVQQALGPFAAVTQVFHEVELEEQPTALPTCTLSHVGEADWDDLSPDAVLFLAEAEEYGTAVQVIVEAVEGATPAESYYDVEIEGKTFHAISGHHLVGIEKWCEAVRGSAT